MDGFKQNQNVIIVAATNRPDVLDEALRRPGRFDREVTVPLPDIKGREQILEVYAKKITMDQNVSLSVIARGTPGFSGADLSNLVNEAAIQAARLNHDLVLKSDFDVAKDKIMMGAERKSIIMPEKERRNTAYHEAGHAVVAHFLDNADPLHKVTIIPRGRALGVTMQLPQEDRYGYGKEELLTNLKVLMGGRIAEEVFLNSMTTGASNDIERATEMARKMVTVWGMSSLGPIHYGDDSPFSNEKPGAMLSDDIKKSVAKEIETILLQQYSAAKEIIISNKDKVIALANALLEMETLDVEDIERVLGTKKVINQFCVDSEKDNIENVNPICDTTGLATVGE